MKFEWDRAKARSNLRKHGISFREATTVFGDPLAAEIADPDHSTDETRWITLGMSNQGRLLMVAHADRGEGCIRVISARPADRHERRAYEEEQSR